MRRGSWVNISMWTSAPSHILLFTVHISVGTQPSINNQYLVSAPRWSVYRWCEVECLAVRRKPRRLPSWPFWQSWAQSPGWPWSPTDPRPPGLHQLRDRTYTMNHGYQWWYTGKTMKAEPKFLLLGNLTPRKLDLQWICVPEVTTELMAQNQPYDNSLPGLGTVRFSNSAAMAWLTKMAVHTYAHAYTCPW